MPATLGLSKYGGSSPPPIAPSSMYGNPTTFGSAVTTQAGDYDKIMSAYKNLTANDGNKPIQSVFNPIAPTLAPDYAASPDVTRSMSNLSDLSATGGYSPSGIADLRARGIAPTRAIYANAQQGLERSKNLSGGYSPNFAAASGRMAREASDQISNINTNVNAGIAQNVASNRLAIAPSFASAAAEQERLKMGREGSNADIVNQINQANEERRLRTEEANRAGINEANRMNLASVEGMRSLYGTTPALVNQFGSNVSDAARLSQGQQQIDLQKQRDRNNLVAPLYA